MITNVNTVQAVNLDQLWRETMYLCVESGYDFLVKGGSYVGQVRKQLPYYTGIVIAPGSFPMVPIMPPGIPGPTSLDKIEEYFMQYIIGDEVAENEVYTYGSFIKPQVDRIVELLNLSYGNTNQATICIGDISTTFLDDPPCLRSISFKMVNDALTMCVYFRSWDLYAGLPENLGGMQMLKEYIGSFLNFEFSDGPIIAFSDGLHLYEQYFDIVDSLNVNKTSISDTAANDKKEFLKREGI